MSEQRDEHIKALIEQHTAQAPRKRPGRGPPARQAAGCRTGEVPPRRRAAAQARLRRNGRGRGMSDTDDLLALQQAALSVQDMRDALSQRREGVAADLTDRIATTEVRQEGFYWVILGQESSRCATGCPGTADMPARR